MDLKTRVDQLLAVDKTIVGPPRWEVGTKVTTRQMKRTLLEDGEARGAFLITQAYPTTSKQEFRHLITFLAPDGRRQDARCICRLDFAPSIDGPHINDFGGEVGYPPCQMPEIHYHDWMGNRHLATAKELPPKLLYARDIKCRINNIVDGFWWFCQQNQITATSSDAPGWPTMGLLL